MLPALGEYAGRLKQNAKLLQCGIDLDDEVGLDAEPLGTVSVSLPDAALAVPAVLAHIPLACRASGAWNRIGPAHDADHQVARQKAARRRCRLDFTKRFMPKNESRFAWRRRSVLA